MRFTEREGCSDGLILCLFCLLLTSTPARTQPASDILPGVWLDTFGGYPPIDGAIVTLAELPDGRLVFGGSFSFVEDRIAHNVGIWDGQSIELPPAGVRSVGVIEPYGGGFLAAGDRSHVHDGVSHGIAWWLEGQWHPLVETIGVSGVTSPHFYDAAVYEGVAYIGGTFSEINGVSSKGVIAWDEDGFRSLAGGVDGQYIFDLEFSDVFALDVSEDGILVIGGNFDEAGGVPAEKLATWDGETWTGFGSERVQYVSGIRALKADSVFISGGFTDESGTITDRLVLWNGDQFSPLGEGVDAPPATMSTTADGRLLVSGVTYSGNTYLGGLAIWDGETWQPAVPSPASGVRTAIERSDGAIAAGGRIFPTGDGATSGLALHTAGTWNSVLTNSNRGLAGTPSDFTTDPTTGDLIVAGPIYGLSGMYLGQLARWDGNEWERIDLPADPPLSVRAVTADEVGRVFVGGMASPPGATKSGVVFRIDGGEISVLGGELNGRVESLVACPDGFLYAGGRMSMANDQIVNHIARWDGDSWYPLGGGLDSIPVDIECDRDGEGIVAAGYFTSSGDTGLSGIGRWSEGVWSTIGGGMGELRHVSSVAWRQDGSLLAAGRFESAGGTVARNIAVWDGTAWHELGGGVSSDVHSITEDINGTVYATGYFHSAGGVEAVHLAAFDDGRWYRLADDTSGIPGNVHATRFGIVFGGNFSEINGIRSNNIAIFEPAEDLAADDRPEIDAGHRTIEAYPNPATGSVTFSITGFFSRTCRIEIHDTLGRQVDALDCPEPRGPSEISWRTDRHAPGTYHAVLVDARARRGPSVSVVVL